MSTQNISFQYKKENHTKLSEICSYEIFSKGLKNEFETALVNEPLVFEPTNFYCTYSTAKISKINDISNIYRMCDMLKTENK